MYKRGGLFKKLCTNSVAFVSMTVGVTASVYAAPIQWTSGVGGNDHWYDAISVPATLTWNVAKTEAEGMGGYLATTTSADENTFVYDSVALANPAVFQPSNVNSFQHGPYIGGFQATSSSSSSNGWEWVTGETWSFTNWNTDEPNDGSAGNTNENNVENYLHYHGIMASVQRSWNDIGDNNSDLVYGYIVEWDQDPTVVPVPAAIWLLGSGLITLVGFARRKKAVLSPS